MKRNAHGTYNIKSALFEENIMVIEFFDQWNIETARECVEECLSTARSRFPSQKWCSLVDYRHWGLCTPEVMEYFNEMVPQFAQSHLTYQAVLPNNQIQSMIVDGYSEIVQDTVTTKYFQSEQEALSWLRKKRENQ
ncbi:hypothetical protein L4C34_17275 [Vibrio profundum]|uniref:DUF7793 family protein n=1 Tax=Vibrio profundum TaxID=2910247 RepID=UPI003D0CA29A